MGFAKPCLCLTLGIFGETKMERRNGKHKFWKWQGATAEGRRNKGEE